MLLFFSEKVRLCLHTPTFRQGALRHVMTPRCSVNPGGGRAKRLAQMKLLESSSARSLSISKKLFVVARQFVFLDQFSVVARHSKKEGHFLTH